MLLSQNQNKCMERDNLGITLHPNYLAIKTEISLGKNTQKLLILQKKYDESWNWMVKKLRLLCRELDKKKEEEDLYRDKLITGKF